MPPPENAFHASELPERIQITTSGKRRKQPVALEDCALKQLTQYNCEVEKNREIVCRPIVRLFRRCADGMTVETTAWDGEHEGQSRMEQKMGQGEKLQHSRTGT